MDIIARKREFLQSLTVHMPRKVRTLFAFGWDTLGANEVVSTRANARRAVLKWSTAKSKMWRLLKNERLSQLLPTLVRYAAPVTHEDTVAVDFSDFGDGRQVLMFAKQTGKGRALPLYFELLEYPIEKGSQNTFVINAIKHFFVHVGCTPTVVFDRGFACPSIIRFLAQNQYRFIVRIKKRKCLSGEDGIPHAAGTFADNDCAISAYGARLRLVRSDDPGNENDPWYLVTNDTGSTREGIIERYYHRFEIEEFFRDAKHLLGFEYLRFKTIRGLRIALWFAILTALFFERIAETLTDRQEYERKRWRVSRFRYVLESSTHALLRLQEQRPYTLCLPFRV